MIQSLLPVAPSTKDQTGVPTLAAARAGAPAKAADALDFAALLQVQAAPATGANTDLSMPAVEFPSAELAASQPPVPVADGKTLPVPASPVADVPADTFIAPAPQAESKETDEAAVDQPTAGETKDSGKEPQLVVVDPAIASALLLLFPAIAVGTPGRSPEAASKGAPPSGASMQAIPAPQVGATELKAPALVPTSSQNLPLQAEARSATAHGSLAVPVRNVTFVEPEPVSSESKPAPPVQAAMAQAAPVAPNVAAAPASQPVVSRPRDKANLSAQALESTPQDTGLVSPARSPNPQDRAAPVEFAPDRPAVAADLSATLTRAAPSGGSSQSPSSPAPHDFAALVDRLVEARQAIAPAAVTAAVAHSDFGRVTLNFRSEGDSLAVSMASADPTFAPAVQAAAQSFGAQSNSDNAAGSQSRNDQGSGGPGQGFVSSQGSGQPQGQSAEQGPSQRARHAQGSTEPALQREQERPAGQDEARDIYA